jgi:hypothetical protein
MKIVITSASTKLALAGCVSQSMTGSFVISAFRAAKSNLPQMTIISRT